MILGLFLRFCRWQCFSDQRKPILGPHDYQPFGIVPAVSYNRRSVATVPRCLVYGIVDIETLGSLYFEVQVIQPVAMHVGVIEAPARLVVSTGRESGIP